MKFMLPLGSGSLVVLTGHRFGSPSEALKTIQTGLSGMTPSFMPKPLFLIFAHKSRGQKQPPCAQLEWDASVWLTMLCEPAQVDAQLRSDLYPPREITTDGASQPTLV